MNQPFEVVLKGCANIILETVENKQTAFTLDQIVHGWGIKRTIADNFKASSFDVLYHFLSVIRKAKTKCSAIGKDRCDHSVIDRFCTLLVDQRTD